ncbi:MAG: complex I NDUFA9 subunit family protein [Wenzhouxiangellaceae bacterium]|nr:complex I NDUFA9 subunit family protein [Wenzhouxiangellaceae bacterium]
MKVLILGATGFVGGHLTRRLSRDGHSVTVTTRHAQAARRLGVIPRTCIRQFDPYDRGRLGDELEGHDALINLVGILNESGRDGSGFRRAHVELVETAIEACRRAGVRRFLHMSALRAGEGDSFYLRTKGEAEAAVRDSGLDWTMFRPSTIFGPDDSFLNRFASLLAIAPVLPLARPDAKMAPVFIDDVVEAFARALTDRDAIGEVYELCGPDVWTLREIVEWLIEQEGLCRKVVGLPDGLGRLQGRTFDFVPGKPFSSDNFKSLLVESVCSDNGFERLGIEPWPMREKAPEWLAEGDRQSLYQRFRSRAGRE